MKEMVDHFKKCSLLLLVLGAKGHGDHDNATTHAPHIDDAYCRVHYDEEDCELGVTEPDDWLSHHNRERCLFKTDPLEWDAELEASAQQYSELLLDKLGCDMQTSAHDHDNARRSNGWGENIYTWKASANSPKISDEKPHMSVYEIVRKTSPSPHDYADFVAEGGWTDEQRARNPKGQKMCTSLQNGFCDDYAGHFTQVVSQQSKKVGCAHSWRRIGSQWCGRAVCRYDPAGNMNVNGRDLPWYPVPWSGPPSGPTKCDEQKFSRSCLSGNAANCPSRDRDSLNFPPELKRCGFGRFVLDMSTTEMTANGRVTMDADQLSGVYTKSTRKYNGRHVWLRDLYARFKYSPAILWFDNAGGVSGEWKMNMGDMPDAGDILLKWSKESLWKIKSALGADFNDWSCGRSLKKDATGRPIGLGPLRVGPGNMEDVVLSGAQKAFYGKYVGACIGCAGVTTLSGCLCKASWPDPENAAVKVGNAANGGCGNPDQDIDGHWCFVHFGNDAANPFCRMKDDLADNNYDRCFPAHTTASKGYDEGSLAHTIPGALRALMSKYEWKPERFGQGYKGKCTRIVSGMSNFNKGTPNCQCSKNTSFSTYYAKSVLQAGMGELTACWRNMACANTPGRCTAGKMGMGCNCNTRYKDGRDKGWTKRFMQTTDGDMCAQCYDPDADVAGPLREVWSAWSKCDVPCGKGKQKRTRSCAGSLDFGGRCGGPAQEEQDCDMPECAAWSDWEDWSACSHCCGPGGKRRKRTCSQPGKCIGQPEEEARCGLDPADACATWGDWSGYGACDVACGDGASSRTRSCDGITCGTRGVCSGLSAQKQRCNAGSCTGWGLWGDWSVCSTTSCGWGTERQTRKCNGASCSGNTWREQSCGEDPNSKGCKTSEPTTTPTAHPINKGTSEAPEGWGPWGEWSNCSRTCGTNAKQQRKRACLSGAHKQPPASFQFCVGKQKASWEARACGKDPCPTDPPSTPSPINGAPVSDYDLQPKKCDKRAAVKTKEECEAVAVANGWVATRPDGTIHKQRKLQVTNLNKFPRGCYLFMGGAKGHFKNTGDNMLNKIYFNTNASLPYKAKCYDTQQCVCRVLPDAVDLHYQTSAESATVYLGSDYDSYDDSGDVPQDLETCDEPLPNDLCMCDFVGLDTDLTHGYYCQSADESVCYNTVEGWCGDSETICTIEG